VSEAFVTDLGVSLAVASVVLALAERFQEAAAAREARLVVAIDRSGRPRVDVLLVDGEPIASAGR
jgi:hypothetical protein